MAVSNKIHAVDVCIVGAGPAGMVLGLLLARFGIKTLVLERHKNFEREYRGEVLMPRFTQMMRQIKLFDWIIQAPHLKLSHLEGYFKNWKIADIQLNELSSDVPFAIWMSQPTLLAKLHEKAKLYPEFDLWFGASVQDLIQENNKTVGVRLGRDGETMEVRAKIVVGADGRFSEVRKAGGFLTEYEDYEIDIIWFTIPKPPNYDNTIRFFLTPRHNFLILPKLPDSIQCGIPVPKGEFTKYRERGIEALKKEIMDAPEVLHPFAKSLKDFSPFNVLQARVDFIKQWARNGCLLIGDAAHTCSPAGAVGVSVAVGTAIVAADVIRDAIKKDDFSSEFLSEVQKRREEEVRTIHKIQKQIQGNIFPSRLLAQVVIPFSIYFLTRTKLFQKLQRKLAVAQTPLPISSDMYL